MFRIFSAGTAALRGQIRNPKLEIRNKHQIQMTNLQNPTQSARPRRLGFEDLLLCSLEFVSDFGFRISDFARHSSQTGGVQQRKMWVKTRLGRVTGVLPKRPQFDTNMLCKTPHKKWSRKVPT